MAGTGVDQVVAIPTGGGGPSGGGGTMARIEGWWHRLPTWGKVVAVIVVIGLIVLVWLFVGGVAGSSNGGSAATLGGSGGAGPGGSGGGGGGGGAAPWPRIPQQQLPYPGGTDQPTPAATQPTPAATQPTTITSPTTPSVSTHPLITTTAPTKKVSKTTTTSTPTRTTTTTTTAHGTIGTYTPTQTSEPVVSSHPALAETTVPAYLPTPTYPSSASQVKPTTAYYDKYHTGYAPQVRSITPQMGGGSNSAAVRLNNAFKQWQKSHPGGTSAQFSAALTGAAQAQAHNSASQVKPTTAYTKKTGLHSYAPQIRGGHTPGMGSSATAPHPKANTYSHPSGLGTSVTSKKTYTPPPNLRQYGA